MTAALPPTTIVVPALNEVAHIQGVIDALLEPGADFVVELIVADGGSTDGTQAAVLEAARVHPRVRLIENPDRLQSAGMNRAVALADPAAEVILRADAHTRYPRDFARKVVGALVESGADSCVVRLKSVGEGGFQRAVAAVSNSRVGSGGSAHRSGGRSGFVDHGHHAAFRRRVFADLGGYDTSFVTNEDAELDYRIRAAGGRIWFASDVEIDYFPRRTPAALARQYWRYGQGRARTFLKHGERLKLRQMLPPAILVGVVLALLLAPVSAWVLLWPAGYLAAVAVAGLALAWSARDASVLAAPLALATMHLAWGGGFLRTLVSGWFAQPAKVREF